MFLAEDFKLCFSFLLDTLHATLNNRWRGCNLYQIKDLSYNWNEVLEKFQRSKQGRHSYPTERLSGNVESSLLGSCYCGSFCGVLEVILQTRCY